MAVKAQGYRQNGGQQVYPRIGLAAKQIGQTPERISETADPVS